MKLYSTSAILLSSLSTVTAVPNTNNPEVADFVDPEAAVLTDEALGYKVFSHYIDTNRATYRCAAVEIKYGSTRYGSLISKQDCTYAYEWVLGCVWRGDANGQAVPTDIQNNIDSYSIDGVRTKTDDSAKFFTANDGVGRSWWDALDACESLFGAGVKLATPRDEEELELLALSANLDWTFNNQKIWFGAFYDLAEDSWYWTGDTSTDQPAENWVRDDSKAVSTFENSEFVEQVDQSAPTQILESMLSAQGLTSSSGSRKKRNTQESATHVDTITALIQRNGCWCPSTLSSGDFFRGAPLNSYDTACRTLSHCVHAAGKCSSGACYSENLNAGFQYAIDVSDLSQGFSCRSENACDTAICMCQVQFAKDVFEMVVAASNTMTIDDGHLDLVSGNAQCVVTAGTNAGGSPGSC